jgi:hypothetical protein
MIAFAWSVLLEFPDAEALAASFDPTFAAAFAETFALAFVADFVVTFTALFVALLVVLFAAAGAATGGDLSAFVNTTVLATTTIATRNFPGFFIIPVELRAAESWVSLRSAYRTSP